MADRQSPDNEPTAEIQAENAQPAPGEDAAETPPTESQPTVSQPVEQVAYSEEAAEAPPQVPYDENAGPTEMIGRSQTGLGSRERMMRRGFLVGGAIVLVAALAFGLMQIIRKDEPPPIVEAAAAEVFLEPATEVGDSPFSPTSFAAEQPAPTNPGTDPLPPPPPAPAPGEDTGAMAVRTANGDLPGLYGGTADVTTCDATLLIDYLAQNPEKGQAWSSVHRIKPDQIPAYVNELTPVLLRTDTRVTDHGYIDVAQALPRQAVLQAGTAVLVDKYGSPRVRCISGSPLVDPVAATAAAPARQGPPPRQAAPPAGAPVVRQAAAPAPRVVFVGPRWPRFDPLTLVVIRRVLRIIDLFVLWDFRRGTLFGRQLGILIRDIIDLANPRLRRLIPLNLLRPPPPARPPAIRPPLQAPRPLPAQPVQRLPARVPPVQQAPAPAPQQPAPAPVQQAPAPAPQPPSAPAPTSSSRNRRSYRAGSADLPARSAHLSAETAGLPAGSARQRPRHSRSCPHRSRTHRRPARRCSGDHRPVLEPGVSVLAAGAILRIRRPH